MTTDQSPPDAPSPAPQPEGEAPRTISSTDLFRGDRELLIEHEGEVYRLRVTRNCRLILQK